MFWIIKVCNKIADNEHIHLHVLGSSHIVNIQNVKEPKDYKRIEVSDFSPLAF